MALPESSMVAVQELTVASGPEPPSRVSDASSESASATPSYVWTPSGGAGDRADEAGRVQAAVDAAISVVQARAAEEMTALRAQFEAQQHDAEQQLSRLQDAARAAGDARADDGAGTGVDNDAEAPAPPATVPQHMRPVFFATYAAGEYCAGGHAVQSSGRVC